MHKKLSTHFCDESNCRGMRSKMRDNSVRSSACPSVTLAVKASKLTSLLSGSYMVLRN